MFDTSLRKDQDDEESRYISEDYTFCQRWRDIGGKIQIDVSVPLNHIGHYAFNGNASILFNKIENNLSQE